MSTIKKLIELYFIFAKMGSVCFGGGYAMLPIIQREIVEKRGWATEEEILDYYAIGQCTPGVIAINTSTFIGNKLYGIKGAIAATLGFVTPSLIIIIIIASLLTNFAHIPVVARAFTGIRICVAVLIVNATVKLWKNAVKDKIGIGICVIVFLLSTFTNISPIVFVVLSGIAGLVISNWKGENKK
ncbi:MAG: chromate transporter [Lachnospirales bacterium]